MEQYKKQAKDLVKAHNKGNPEAIQRIQQHHPRAQKLAKLTLADAQMVIAREHGFESWPKFVLRCKIGELGFGRYTERARRVIFFARYEASEFGSPCIETEHLLLGLLREDDRLPRFRVSMESVRKQIEAQTIPREKIPTSVDLPLSHECKRVLEYGAEEAEWLNGEHIGTEHLLLGLLREPKGLAADILRERGLRLAQVREEIAGSS